MLRKCSVNEWANTQFPPSSWKSAVVHSCCSLDYLPTSQPSLGLMPPPNPRHLPIQGQILQEPDAQRCTGCFLPDLGCCAQLQLWAGLTLPKYLGSDPGVTQVKRQNTKMLLLGWATPVLKTVSWTEGLETLGAWAMTWFLAWLAPTHWNQGRLDFNTYRWEWISSLLLAWLKDGQCYMHWVLSVKITS